MGKILNFQELKNKKNKKKYIVHIILGFIIFYIFLSIYWLVKTPSDTIMVDTGTLTLEESSTGYILREETVLKGENFKNGLTPIVAEGERAAKGQTVFRYNGMEEEATKEKIEEINSKIQETLANQPNLFTTTDIKILEKQIDEKTQNLKNLTDISTINEYKKQIMEIIDKEAKIAGSQSRSGAYIQQLTKEKEEYENKLTEDSEYITAPISGVVSYRVDGYEDILNVEDFSTITKNALNNLDLKTGKIVSTSLETGKIINNFKCYIATILDSEVAKNAEIGKKVKITLSSGNEISSEIKYIAKEENEETLIIFELKTLTQELIEHRKISFNITWWNASGYKVPNTCILEDEQGLKYVVRRKNGEDKKIIVKVLNKNEKYSIIESYKDNELNSLGIDIDKNQKITKYDNILLYPSK